MINIVKEWIKNLIGKANVEINVEEEALTHKPKEIKIGKKKKPPLYEQMTKKELETYAREEFNVDLDRRHNKKRLLNQVRKLVKEK